MKSAQDLQSNMMNSPSSASSAYSSEQLIMRAKKLLDAIYSEEDAQQDADISAAKSDNLNILNKMASKKLSSSESLELQDFINVLKNSDEKPLSDLNNLLAEIKSPLSRAQLTAPENNKSGYQILIDQIAQLEVEGQFLNVEQRDHVQSILSNLNVSGVLQTGNITHITTQINNILEQKPSPPVDVIAYQEKLRSRYSAEDFSMIKPLFGKSLEMEGQYINLQLIYHVKDKDKDKEKNRMKLHLQKNLKMSALVVLKICLVRSEW